MAAQLRPIATELEEAEFQLTANRCDAGRDEYVTGLVRGFDLALQRARVLAYTGWRVTVDPVDRFCVEAPFSHVRATFEPVA